MRHIWPAQRTWYCCSMLCFNGRLDWAKTCLASCHSIFINLQRQVMWKWFYFLACLVYMLKVLQIYMKRVRITALCIWSLVCSWIPLFLHSGSDTSKDSVHLGYPVVGFVVFGYYLWHGTAQVSELVHGLINLSIKPLCILSETFVIFFTTFSL